MIELGKHDALAILASGGLDSAILLGLAVGANSTVFPIYVRTGLAWETDELQVLIRFLADISAPNLRPLVILEQSIHDLYGDHWSTRGEIPGPTAPDEDFYLPGRNVVLLAKPLIWCRLNNVPTIALATLAANPFPDATPEFFRNYAAVVSEAVGGSIDIVAPFRDLSKSDVIRLGAAFPLNHTLSCMNPRDGRHCGICGKCAERGRAFLAAGVPDPTSYAARAWEGTDQVSATARPWE